MSHPVDRPRTETPSSNASANAKASGNAVSAKGTAPTSARSSPGGPTPVKGKPIDLAFTRPPKLEAFPGLPVRAIEEIKRRLDGGELHALALETSAPPPSSSQGD